MTQKQILEYYSAYLIKHSERPKSFTAFASEIGVEESSIYEHFTSFSSMEAHILNHFVLNAIDLTKENFKELEHNIAKESMLTFYYSLMEVLTANRSLVLMILPSGQNFAARTNDFKVAKSSFLQFFGELNFEIPALTFVPESAVKNKAKETAVWGQFCSIIAYWVKDDSKSFEKTDVFIEKNLKLSFDLAESSVLESFVDFGKFLFKKS